MQISRHKQVPFALMSWLWLANAGYVPKMTFCEAPISPRFTQSLPTAPASTRAHLTPRTQRRWDRKDLGNI